MTALAKRRRGAPTGERSGFGKLTADVVRACWLAHVSHTRQQGAHALAHMSGVSHRVVLAALNGDTWREI